MQEILVFLQHHWILTTALAAVLILLIILEFIKIQRGTSRLSSSQVIQLINHENAAIIDLRAPDVFVNGHIVGSISLPARELSEKIKRIEKYKSQPIVLVCGTGDESIKAIPTLVNHGFQRVYTLRGGINAWKMADMPLVKD
jgi:rhodanese-related sulfurtransferase